jgi:predicted nucleotidyltransferase
VSTETGPHLSQPVDIAQRTVSEFADRLREQLGDEVVSIWMYGSRARGDARPDSDIDLAVVLSDVSPERRQAVRHLAVEVWLEHGIYLSTRVWSTAHWHELERLQTLLYRNICAEGIAL